MKEIEIGEHSVGKGNKTFIIAEIGLNHNGKVDLAKRLIKKAADAGVDAVKFQMFNTDELCTQETDYYDNFSSAEFSREEWKEVKEEATNQDVIFTSSVFDKQSAELLNELGSPVYKVASGDITHIPLLKSISQKNKPAIISTGMSSLKEIEEAVETFYSNQNENICLLHCVSNYPANLESINLEVINTLKSAFGVPVGFSDHTLGIRAPLLAVASGADIIEKHFTLDRSMEGPDHELSLNPSELGDMVEGIREVEKALGDGIKKPTEGEIKSREKVRRSITARHTIKKGKTIKEEDIKIVRPAEGIAPKNLDLVLGREVRKEITPDDPITWALI